MGTFIRDLQVTRIIDGDTLYVLIHNKEEMLRLIYVDTEESQPSSSKPVTRAGYLASQFAKDFFTDGKGPFCKVDIEFDYNDPEEYCLMNYRDNYGRLLVYVHKNGVHYNLKLVEEGLSPYFMKYGRSRSYLREFMMAEFEAQSKQLNIWNPLTNQGGTTRDYTYLIAWWSFRAGIVQHYRRMVDPMKVPNPRESYNRILDGMNNQEELTVFCDLGDGVVRKSGKGAVIFAGSKFRKFNLWIEDQYSDLGLSIIRLVETRYAKGGRGYAYVTGKILSHKGRPEIILTDIHQISDFPPRRD